MIEGAEEYALLKKGDGKILYGKGPFTELESCPQDGVAFYVNDFALSDSRPWKVPSSYKVVDRVSDLAEELNLSKSETEINWDELGPDEFARVFTEINQAIGKGEIEKSVPVAVEKGSFKLGAGSCLLYTSDAADEG